MTLPHLRNWLTGRVDDGTHDADLHFRLGDRFLVFGRKMCEDVYVFSVLVKLLLLVIEITLMLLMLLLAFHRIIAQRIDRFLKFGILEFESGETIKNLFQFFSFFFFFLSLFRRWPAWHSRPRAGRRRTGERLRWG